MSLFNFRAVVKKVHTLLATDSRTSAINWYNGRRSREQMQTLPAGNVYLGPGTIVPYTLPAGEQSPMTVLIELLYETHEGAETADQLLADGIDAVAEVLIDNWDLGLAYVLPDSLSWRPIVNPEGSPVPGLAEIRLDVRIIPTGV